MSKRKLVLTQAVLMSLSFLALTDKAQATLTTGNCGGTTTVTSGNMGYTFACDNSTLSTTGVNVGQTSGISIENQSASNTNINFNVDGTITVDGKVGATNPLNFVNLNWTTKGQSITFNGDVDATAQGVLSGIFINTTPGTIIFGDNASPNTTNINDVTANGSTIIFDGTSNIGNGSGASIGISSIPFLLISMPVTSTGTVTASDASLYATNTNVDNGTLVISSALVQGNLNVSNNGTSSFSNGSQLRTPGSGTGNLTVNNNGIVSFADTSRINGGDAIVNNNGMVTFAETSNTNPSVNNVTGNDNATLGFSNKAYVNGNLILNTSAAATFADTSVVFGNVTLNNNSTASFAETNLSKYPSGITADITGDVTGNDSTKLTFSNAASVEGNVILNTSATTSFSNTSSVVGDVTLNNSTTGTFSDSTSITGDVVLNSTAAGTFSGSSTINGNLTLNTSATASFSGSSAVNGNTTVNGNSQLSIANPHTFSGDLNINNTATLSLAPSVTPLTLTGGFNFNNGSTLILDFNKSTTAPNIVADNTSVVKAGNLTVNNPPMIAPNTTAYFDIVTAPDTSTLSPLMIHQDTFLTHYSTRVVTDITPGTDVIQLVIMQSSLSSVTDNPLAPVIDSIGSVGGTLGQIVTILGQTPNITTLNQYLNELEPIVDRGLLQTIESLQNTFDIIDERIVKRHHKKHLRINVYDQGHNYGDLKGRPFGTWVKPFGQHMHQDLRNDIDGFKGEMWGVAAGADTTWCENNLIGIAGSWTHLHVDHEILSATSEVESYQGTVYGTYEFNNPFYFEWLAGGAYNNYRNQSSLDFGTLVVNPQAHFYGWQVGARGEMGYEILYFNWRFTPIMSLLYAHLHMQDFTETNAGNAGRQINAQSFNLIRGGTGIRIARDIVVGDELIQPEFHARTYYDFKVDPVAINAQFIGGGIPFVENGFIPPRPGYNLGVSVNTFSNDSGLVISAGYDANLKDEYIAHTGSLKFKYEW